MPVRRPKQTDRVRLDGALAPAQLGASLSSRDRRERRMVPRMVGDGVARLGDRPDQPWMSMRRGADHEERGPGVVPREQAQDAGGGGRVWAVVEGQTDERLA